MITTTSIFLLLSFTNCERNATVHSPQKNASTQTEHPTKNISIDFPAKVIRIVDGDTLEVLYGELPVMIRLAHVDSPEKKQAFGTKAKQALSDLCFGQEIEIEYKEKDRNSRYICVIYKSDGTNINQEMVKLGMAWHFKKYSNDDVYSELETEARKNKVGLWQDPNPIAPWDWRK